MWSSRARMLFKAMKAVTAKSTPFVIPITAAAIGGTFLTSNPTAMKVVRKKKGSASSTISLDELAKHTDEGSLWVTYQGSVYDVTDFLEGHPGGTERLLMAAGKDLEPFFDVYTEHYRGHVLPFLQRFKIGQLSDSDAKKAKDFVFTSPYEGDPERHPDLLHCTTHPFNGEPRAELLTKDYYTPNELHYVRNHHAVPDIEDGEYTLEVSGTGVSKPTTFTLNDLKRKFKKYEVVNCLQCASNRAEDFHGNLGGAGEDQLVYTAPHWIIGAISNAKWGGARMRDVLASCGVDVDSMTLGKIDPHSRGMKHVQFEAYDENECGDNYGVSVPIDKVLDPHGGCLVAYEMNGEPVPADHGKPVRAVVPGFAGCRSTKWLSKMTISDEESAKHYQDRSYLVFAPDMHFDGKLSEGGDHMGEGLWKWTKDPELKSYLDYQRDVTYGHLGRSVLQIQPVTSIICNPSQATCVAGSPDFIEVKGVAHSFGGSGINRVDVSIDGGKHWTAADLYKPEDVLKTERFEKMFGWTQFSKKVPLTQEMKAQLGSGHRVYLELVSKGVDTHFNVQPESSQSYYNARGIVVNHMYRVPLIVDPNNHRAQTTLAELNETRNQYFLPGENPKGRTGQEFPNKPSGGLFREPWVHDRKQ